MMDLYNHSTWYVNSATGSHLVKQLDENTIPEIQRTNMGNVVLLLKNMGIHDIFNFDLMDHSLREALLKASERFMH